VAEAIQKDKDKKDKTVSISLSVRNDKSITIQIIENGRASTNRVNAKSGELPLDDLENRLVELKQKYPETYSISLNPGESLTYSDIVKVMDRSRSTKKQKFIVVDPKTQERVEHNQMFPNLVFANVVEG